jgi:hypothetical protein
MKKLVFVAASLLATSAFAQINFVGRVDYENTPKYNKGSETPGTQSAEVDGSSKFNWKFGRLHMNGKVGEATAKIALDLHKGVGTGTSSIQDLVDFAFVEHTLGDFVFTAGKLDGALGGFEEAAIDQGRSHLATLANGGPVVAVGPSTGMEVVVTPGNVNGVGVAYVLDGHTVGLQVLDTYQTTNPVHKRNGMNLFYLGDFDEMFNLRLAYGVGIWDDVVSSYDATYINAGVKGVLAESFHYAVEYFDNTAKRQQQNAKADKTTSMYAQLKYNINEWTPLLKYEMSTNKIAEDAKNNDSFTRNAFVLGLEYAPTENITYYSLYKSISDKHDGKTVDDPGPPPVAGKWNTNETVNWSQFALGLRYTGSILQ